MLYSAAMATVKRRDVNALVLLIALELGLLCLLGVTFRFGGDRELERGAAPVGPLAFDWLVPESPPTEIEAVVAAPPVEPPKPAEPARKTPVVRVPEPIAKPEAAPPAPVAAPVVMASLAPTPEREKPVDRADACGGDLCCVAAAKAQSVPTAPLDVSGESDNPDRVMLTWPASRRDDVVYRVFTLPNRRFVGSSAENAFAHIRQPDDPDCYKIQACDRAGGAAGGPLTICITRRRIWGA